MIWRNLQREVVGRLMIGDVEYVIGVQRRVVVFEGAGEVKESKGIEYWFWRWVVWCVDFIAENNWR